MKSRLVKNNILISILACTLTVVIGMAVFMLYIQNTMYEQVQSQTALLKHMLEETPEDNFVVLYEATGLIQGRVTYVYHNGLVTYDSVYDVNKIENYGNRPEIKDALAKGMGIAQRVDEHTGRMTYYCAAKVGQDSAVRIAITTSTEVINILYTGIPLFIASVLLILWICFIISERTSKKIVYNIENYDIEGNKGDIYEELLPFVNKISRQNVIINEQIQSITEEKRKLQSVFENIKESIIVCDNSLVIIQTNPEAHEVFSGLTVGNSFSRSVNMPELTDMMKKSVTGKTVQNVLLYNDRWYQCISSPNYYNGQIGAIMIVMDITDQIERERRRRRFTDNVTHELKTPLTSILGYSQLITNKIAKKEDIRGFAAIIEDNATVLLGMIDDVIRISSLETGDGIEKKYIELDKIIKRVIKQQVPTAAKKDIKIIDHLRQVKIYADESQMYQLVQNLLSNAIKYNKQLGTVHISLEKESGTAVLIVKDSGIGIHSKDIDKIFERFFVADKSRNKNISSSGLGLAIVKHIVNNHNGNISVKSVPEQGTEFKVELPLE